MVIGGWLDRTILEVFTLGDSMVLWYLITSILWGNALWQRQHQQLSGSNMIVCQEWKPTWKSFKYAYLLVVSSLVHLTRLSQRIQLENERSTGLFLTVPFQKFAHTLSRLAYAIAAVCVLHKGRNISGLKRGCSPWAWRLNGTLHGVSLLPVTQPGARASQLSTQSAPFTRSVPFRCYLGQSSKAEVDFSLLASKHHFFKPAENNCDPNQRDTLLFSSIYFSQLFPLNWGLICPITSTVYVLLPFQNNILCHCNRDTWCKLCNFQQFTQFAGVKTKFRAILRELGKDNPQGCSIQNHWRAPGNVRWRIVYGYQWTDT